MNERFSPERELQIVASTENVWGCTIEQLEEVKCSSDLWQLREEISWNIDTDVAKDYIMRALFRIKDTYPQLELEIWRGWSEEELNNNTYYWLDVSIWWNDYNIGVLDKDWIALFKTDISGTHYNDYLLK